VNGRSTTKKTARQPLMAKHQMGDLLILGVPVRRTETRRYAEADARLGHQSMPMQCPRRTVSLGYGGLQVARRASIADQVEVVVTPM